MSQLFPVNAPQEIDLGIYEHYKKKQYEVLGVSLENTNQNKFVLYRALYGEYDLWLRPLPMFQGMVQGEDGLWKKRFTRISSAVQKNNAYHDASFLV